MPKAGALFRSTPTGVKGIIDSGILPSGMPASKGIPNDDEIRRLRSSSLAEGQSGGAGRVKVPEAICKGANWKIAPLTGTLDLWKSRILSFENNKSLKLSALMLSGLGATSTRKVELLPFFGSILTSSPSTVDLTLAMAKLPSRFFTRKVCVNKSRPAGFFRSSSAETWPKSATSGFAYRSGLTNKCTGTTILPSFGLSVASDSCSS